MREKLVQMKRITTTATGLVALVAMLALGMVSAGSASAHEFLYTGPLPVLLLILSDNKQVFEVVPAGLAISCPHFRGHILFSGSTMHGTTAKVTGEYPGKCEVTGGSKATISPVEYELSAEGTISVLNTITITAGSPALCSLLVEPATNKNLSTLLFLKDPAAPTLALLVHVAVGGIHSVGTNGTCATGGQHTNGTYFGLVLVWVDGGTIQWD
jgi:hypothetical protein